MGRSADRAGADRYRRACRELGEKLHVVRAVVVSNHGCSTWAYAAGLRRGEGMTMLREGLGRLRTFYAQETVAAAE